jgi:hypothetical protein
MIANKDVIDLSVFSNPKGLVWICVTPACSVILCGIIVNVFLNCHPKNAFKNLYLRSCGSSSTVPALQSTKP